MTNQIDVSERELQAFARFLKLLPHGRDRELVILKAHLLVEEQLRQLIAERVRNREPLLKARLTFSQCISVARAFLPAGHDPGLWKGLEQLNEIRNAFSHQLSPARIEEKIAAFSASMQPNGPMNEDPAVNFELALWSLFASVAHLLERPSAQVLKLVPRELSRS
jgi:hypothetical protein